MNKLAQLFDSYHQLYRDNKREEHRENPRKSSLEEKLDQIRNSKLKNSINKQNAATDKRKLRPEAPLVADSGDGDIVVGILSPSFTALVTFFKLPTIELKPPLVVDSRSANNFRNGSAHSFNVIFSSTEQFS
uniref:Uncharacterized protein n=1 Tax=Romanomermis culicivorax TaxID=13658 RepID=A0A915LCY8_ROMCU